MTFTQFYNLYIEAISLKDSSERTLTRKKAGGYKMEVLNKVFDGKDRLVLDLLLKVHNYTKLEDDTIYTLVKQELVRSAYLDIDSLSHEDYLKGVVYTSRDTNKRQPQRIGKLLNKMVDYPDYSTYERATLKNLANAFRDDPDRAAGKNGTTYKIVISRHPYDIAGMSTDRNWTSCMDLGLPHIEYKDKANKNEPGQFHDLIAHDIRAGTMVAYLVASTDVHKNGKMAIKRPLSRIALKPVKSMKDASLYKYNVGKMYGVKVSEFHQKVTDWVLHNINDGDDKGLYFKNPALYEEDDDTYPNINIVNLKEHTKPEVLDRCKIHMNIIDVSIFYDRIGLYFAVDERLPSIVENSSRRVSDKDIVQTRFKYPVLEMLGIGISPDTPDLTVHTSDRMLLITLPIGPPSYRRNMDYSAEEYVEDLVSRISKVLPNGVDSDKFVDAVVAELDDDNGKFGDIFELEVLTAWDAEMEYIADDMADFSGSVMNDAFVQATIDTLQNVIAGSPTPLETLNDIMTGEESSLRENVIKACIRWKEFKGQIALVGRNLATTRSIPTDHPYRHLWDDKVAQFIAPRWAIITPLVEHITKYQDVQSWRTYAQTHQITFSLETAIYYYLKDYTV